MEIKKPGNYYLPAIGNVNGNNECVVHIYSASLKIRTDGRTSDPCPRIISTLGCLRVRLEL